MNKLRQIIYSIGIAVICFASVSCSDQSEEITAIDYNRLFSPINLKATVTNKTNVRLEWTPVADAEHYNVELYANDNLTFAGAPIRTYTVTNSDLPYVISGLEGETDYSARIQAINETKESNH